jgi:hypothetical protein
MSFGFRSGDGIPVWHGPRGGPLNSVEKAEMECAKNEITMKEFSNLKLIGCSFYFTKMFYTASDFEGKIQECGDSF